METLLRDLVRLLSAYGAKSEYISSYDGVIILGEVRVGIEINVRRVARVEGKRFLYGSRRGYNEREIAVHILTRLPALQERAKRDKEWAEQNKSHEDCEKAARELTRLVDDKRIRCRYDRYDSDENKFSMTFKTNSFGLLQIVCDAVREMEDYGAPREARAQTSDAPMRFSFVDENNDPTGNELTLNSMAAGGIDLDRAVKLVVGELMVTEDFRIIRIS